MSNSGLIDYLFYFIHMYHQKKSSQPSGQERSIRLCPIFALPLSSALESLTSGLKEKLPTFWSGAFYPALSYFCLAAIFGVRELNFWVKLRHDFECPVHTIRFFYALYIGAGYHLSSIRLAYVCPKSAPICAPTFILPVPGIGIILHFWTDTAIRERSSGFETGNWSFPEDGEIPRL